MLQHIQTLEPNKPLPEEYWNARLYYLIYGKKKEGTDNRIILAPRTIQKTYTQTEFTNAYNLKNVSQTPPKSENTKIDNNKKTSRISQSDVSHWLNVGNINKNKKITFPTAQTILKIANFFSVSTDYLLGISDYTTPDNDYIGRQTGLNEASINTIKNPYETIFWSYIKNTFYDALNKFLSNKEFMQLIKSYSEAESYANGLLMTRKAIEQKKKDFNVLIAQDKDLNIALKIEMGEIIAEDEDAPELTPELSKALETVRSYFVEKDKLEYEYNNSLELLEVKKYRLTLEFSKLLDAILPTLPEKYDLPY